MPPVHLKLQEAPKITTLPDDSFDLFDIITNVVTKSNSQIVYKKAKPKREVKFRCGICDKSVNKNQKSIDCNNCGLWVHKSCEGLTDGELILVCIFYSNPINCYFVNKSLIMVVIFSML